MHGLEIRVQLTPDKRREFLQAFDLFSGQSASDDTCLNIKLFEDVAGHNQFLWIEHWRDAKALDIHVQSDQFRSLLGAIDVLGELESLRMVEFKAFNKNT